MAQLFWAITYSNYASGKITSDDVNASTRHAIPLQCSDAPLFSPHLFDLMTYLELRVCHLY